MTRFFWLGLCALSLLGWGVGHAETILLDKAKVVMRPHYSSAMQTAVTLPHRWDHSFPHEGGRAVYQLAIPPLKGDGLKALYILRVGNQAQIKLNGEVLAELGDLGDARFDAIKSPFWLSLPASVLDSAQDAVLEIEVSTQYARSGGLSEVFVGDKDDIKKLYEKAYWWRQIAYGLMGMSLLLVGLLAIALWIRHRDKLYGYFTGVACFGVLRALDRVIPDVAVPWSVWNVLMLLAQAYYMIFVMRFALCAVDCNEAWVRRWFRIFLLVCAITAVMTQISASPYYLDITLMGFTVLASCALFYLLRLVVRESNTWLREGAPSQRFKQSALVFCVSALVFLAGLRDYFLVELSPLGMGRYELLPSACFLFVMLMAWLIIDRYSIQNKQYQALNATLEQRVLERERQLSESFERIQQQGEERATLLERQRIMSDIHDGVGSQLVGLVNMIKQGVQTGELDQQQLKEHAQMALDELRVAVDSMQPVDGDLATVLATLRYRLEPRLRASNIQLQWEVEDLPVMDRLTPTKVLHIQKILLEAFTNIMVHAKAKHVQVSATHDVVNHQVVIRLADDGVGFDADKQLSRGHGLDNMRFRAQTIGASLAFESSRHEAGVNGVTVVLTLPL